MCRHHVSYYKKNKNYEMVLKTLISKFNAESKNIFSVDRYLLKCIDFFKIVKTLTPQTLNRSIDRTMNRKKVFK